MRELPLSQPGAEDIHGVVSAGYVFSKVELRQQLGARKARCGLGFLTVGMGNRSLGILPKRPVDGLPER